MKSFHYVCEKTEPPQAVDEAQDLLLPLLCSTFLGSLTYGDFLFEGL